MPDTENATEITATLIRGRTYFHGDTRFDRNVPKTVDRGLAETLEDMIEEIADSDGEVVEKPMFRVDYDAPLANQVPSGRSRMSRVTRARDDDGEEGGKEDGENAEAEGERPRPPNPNVGVPRTRTRVRSRNS